MSYLLKNRQEEFHVTTWHWRPLLRLAEKYGWEHPGTLRPFDYPKDKEWNGNYWWNSGQIVTNEDAKNLAQALERSLVHIPDEEKGIRAGHVGRPEEIKAYHKQEPEIIFSGRPRYKDFVENAIRFFKQGSFEIH